ncbi:MAG: heparinase II/III family protein, partial [Caenispirillum sp.]|nr:heparinase II/III family protein [Caenispirillum sp.]
KYLWEPNRHAELVTLAQAWQLSGERRFADGCRRLLESWFEQCPYPLGPNWTSSLEHGVRLANWAVAWCLLGEQNLEAGFRRRWLDAVYRHCHFIAGHFSRHSSANNHLLGELLGLFLGATVWPLWPESARWRAQAARQFEAEALKQTAEDGVNREQAVWYQHEVADMMLLAGLFGRANGIEFSAGYWRRLEKMLEFVAALMDAGGHVPMIGDADDARLVRFDPRPDADVFRSLLATGAVVFGRGDFKAKAGAFDDKSRWLLGDAAAAHFAALPAEPGEPRREFPLGGYWILGRDFDTGREVRIVADAGPLGYLSLAAHGHADALAFTLSVAGREILVDPGTFAYHTQRRWRDHFKGTRAHNTVCVDGLDQSVSGGNFLWLRHARARCERFVLEDRRETWTGSQDGYLRLPDPLLHRRTLDFDKTAGVLRVTDRLECAGRHRVEVLFHAAETCEVEHLGAEVRVRNGPAKVSLRNTAPGWAPQLVRGGEAPPLGWVSRRFDEKEAATVIVWAGGIEGTTECVTEIVIG